MKYTIYTGLVQYVYVKKIKEKNMVSTVKKSPTSDPQLVEIEKKSREKLLKKRKNKLFVFILKISAPHSFQSTMMVIRKSI